MENSINKHISTSHKLRWLCNSHPKSSISVTGEPFHQAPSTSTPPPPHLSPSSPAAPRCMIHHHLSPQSFVDCCEELTYACQHSKGPLKNGHPTQDPRVKLGKLHMIVVQDRIPSRWLGSRCKLEGMPWRLINYFGGPKKRCKIRCIGVVVSYIVSCKMAN